MRTYFSRVLIQTMEVKCSLRHTCQNNVVSLAASMQIDKFTAGAICICQRTNVCVCMHVVIRVGM